ncbi:MAG: hypothetical protein ACR2OW_05720 [Methyloligellaceae bacterium]
MSDIVTFPQAANVELFEITRYKMAININRNLFIATHILGIWDYMYFKCSMFTPGAHPKENILWGDALFHS